MVCFVHFDFEMCFAPQRRALFRHRNFQKWSDHGVFCTFWLRNVLRATTACTFSTSQLPKVVRPWCVLYILTWKCASRHNGVHFCISHLASWLRTRRFSEPTFRPSGAPNHWKDTVFRDFPTFSRICIFCLLTLSLLIFSLLIFLFSLPLPCSAFHLSILSEVWLLSFLRKVCPTIDYRHLQWYHSYSMSQLLHVLALSPKTLTFCCRFLAATLWSPDTRSPSLSLQVAPRSFSKSPGAGSSARSLAARASRAARAVAEVGMACTKQGHRSGSCCCNWRVARLRSRHGFTRICHAFTWSFHRISWRFMHEDGGQGGLCMKICPYTVHLWQRSDKNSWCWWTWLLLFVTWRTRWAEMQ